jgi:putative ABC transport system permease protein
MNHRPPKLALQFLSWFCPAELHESIEGDLLEVFVADCKSGYRLAKWKFIWNVFRFFRPGIIFRNKMNMHLISLSMLRSYFVLSWRHILKNKIFATINIAGLAAGMAAALLIYDYVSFERSFESFHKNADNIYRVSTIWNKDLTPEDKRATTMPWSGPNVKNEFPEVADYAFFTPIANFTGYNSVSYGDRKITEPNIFLADNGFLRMFSFQLLRGDPERALADANSIVITKSIAEKYFAQENPIGKTLVLDTHENLTQNVFKVTGVMEDPPANSHLDFDFLISFNVIHKELHEGSTFWHWDYTYVYLQLHPGVDVSALERKMSELRLSQFGKDMQYYSDLVEFDLQPIRDIHLQSNLRGELGLNGDGRAVLFLSIIGACILLSAYINYINLSTMKAVERKTEIGIRKVIGSTKVQLVMQLFVESLLFNGFAVLAASLIYLGSIPLLENAFNIEWPERAGLFSVDFFIFGTSVFLAGAILSISYPALILSSFKPAIVLKGKGTMLPSTRGFDLRKALIVCQFSFCIVFTIGTYAVYLQLQHMRNFDLGMNMNHVIAVRGFGFQKYDVFEKFKNTLASNSSVRSIGATSAAPGDEVIQLSFKPKVHVEGKTSVDQELRNVLIDEGYLQTLDVQLIAGRDFDRSIRTDSESVIINEAAAKLLGFDDPSQIVNESLANMADKPRKIIGVIRNYNQRSLRQQYEPLVFSPLWNNDYGWHNRYYLVKFEEARSFSDYQNNIAILQKAWKEANPERPFQYFFLDTYFDNQYKAETTFSGLYLFFSGAAIFIACLGLFGLVAYAALQRTKEIGVRKVLGATVKNILTLLSKDFMKLILLATAISVPLVSWLLSSWLNQYAFRILITVWLFALPLAGIFALALLTVVLKSLKVATANPVDSLRYE